MKRVIAGAMTLAGAGVAVTRWLISRRGMPVAHRDPMEASRWLGVTINRPPDEVAPGGRLPERLTRLDAEVRMNRAPGDRGTEVYARPHDHVPTGAAAVLARLRGNDPRRDVRTALREAKSIIETGEVLQSDEPFGTTRPTMPGKVLDAALGRARGEGRL